VATRAVAWGTGTTTVRYQHTDSLGSPVAETDASGNLVKRNAYAPYGEAFGATVIDGTGYTGHVMDRDTGLTYMQQRYYDPQVGRFLNVDPIATDANSGVNFGRYWYANNNPYKFSDPDGRATTIVINGNIGADPATWGGRHAGLVISRDGETSVYDPNGSYRPKNQDRSSSGMFEDASAEDYVNYQKTDGPDVRTYTFNTTPEQEAAILNRIQPADGSNGEGEAGFFSCSTHVSNVLSGIGPLANVNRETLLPSNLESQIVEAKNAQDQLAKEPKMQVIGEIR
ncbi:RHS repeat-associated core domain-containing protein, partial [Arenimonas oryziterrae]